MRASILAGVDVVNVDLRKWPDTAHWRYSGYRLGADRHGSWLYIPSTMTTQRGSDEPRMVRSAFVTVVDTSKWWTANFYIGHPFLSAYVNISTPPTWGGDRLRAIDLDLDVMRDLDGRVEVLDEDEFALHQRTLAYPADLIAHAREAADLAARLVAEGVEPFGTAADPWLSQARELEEQALR